MNLNLAWSCQGAREEKLHVINFQSDFFAQFAAHGFFRLFALVEKAAGNSPATVRTKFMLEQQDAALLIEHNRARCNSESLLPKTHQPATKHTRKETKDRAKDFREHERRIACAGKANAKRELPGWDSRESLHGVNGNSLGCLVLGVIVAFSVLCLLASLILKRTQ